MRNNMRRTPPDRTGRLPAPHAVLVPRSRLAPLAIALPLVLGLWLTIGLPIFAEVSGTAGGGGPMRDFLFGAAATGGSPGSGGDRRGPGAGAVAAAVIDPKIVREVRLERIHELTTVYVTHTRVHRGHKPGAARNVHDPLPQHNRNFDPATSPLSAPLPVAPPPPPPPVPLPAALPPPPPPPPPAPLPAPPPRPRPAPAPGACPASASASAGVSSASAPAGAPASAAA